MPEAEVCARKKTVAHACISGDQHTMLLRPSPPPPLWVFVGRAIGFSECRVWNVAQGREIGHGGAGSSGEDFMVNLQFLTWNTNMIIHWDHPIVQFFRKWFRHVMLTLFDAMRTLPLPLAIRPYSCELGLGCRTSHFQGFKPTLQPNRSVQMNKYIRQDRIIQLNLQTTQSLNILRSKRTQ